MRVASRGGRWEETCLLELAALENQYNAVLEHAREQRVDHAEASEAPLPAPTTSMSTERHVIAQLEQLVATVRSQEKWREECMELRAEVAMLRQQKAQCSREEELARHTQNGVGLHRELERLTAENAALKNELASTQEQHQSTQEEFQRHQIAVTSHFPDLLRRLEEEIARHTATRERQTELVDSMLRAVYSWLATEPQENVGVDAVGATLHSAERVRKSGIVGTHRSSFSHIDHQAEVQELDASDSSSAGVLGARTTTFYYRREGPEKHKWLICIALF